MEDKEATKETLIIKGGGRPKITHFWSPNKGLREEEEDEEEEEEEESDQTKVWIHDFCMDIWSLVWNLSMC